MNRVVALFTLLAAACSYDFDRYAAPADESAEGGEGGALARGGTSGKGGASEETAGTSGASSAGKGGGGAGGKGGSAGSMSAGEGGDAGTGGSDQGGEAGEPTAGTAGSAGTASTAGNAGTGGSAGFDCAALSGTTFDGHCYFAVGNGAGLAFDEAAAACAANDGASLVAITSENEQNALEAAFFPASTDYWIGLSLEGAPEDVPIECSIFDDVCPFEWITAEALTFTDWALRDGDNEPNYSGACVRIQADDLAWADFGCTSPLPAICER